jgi:hypothetical protein
MTLPLNAQRPCPRYALRVLYFLPVKVFILRGPPSLMPPLLIFLAIVIYLQNGR